ncbi:DUF882 domain-containing protein [Bradyrhizobium oligotrophicum]|uniref:DUF882 domain-containing protein n=1 Tax=Bradyrhizobium oligotrophicum TaxID=44255 RepID=UPI003EBB2215
MLSVFARQSRSLPRAGWNAVCRYGLASLLLLMGAGTIRDAEALNETRSLSFHHTHSGEDLTVTFKREGRYDEDALKKLNHFLRDWRTQDETVMDRRLFDILWEVYRDVDGKQPIQIISSYRSPATNSMLRRRSQHTGVARHSQHMLGHAMDFYIPGVPLEQIRYAGLRLQRGGVGFYPTSGSPFVHLDTGNIRHWPRMTADQLARVFPDGKTVHVPSNGVPLKGYEVAKAEIEKRGPGDDASSGRSNLFARLFRGRPSEDDDEAGESESKADGKPVQTAALSAKATDKSSDKERSADNKASTARGKIANALQLASADAQEPMAAKSEAKSETRPETTSAIAGASRDGAPQSVADIINARGFWGDNPSAPKQATPEQVAAITARRALSSIDQTQTASLMQAMAFAPQVPSSADRANAGGTTPIPVRNSRPATRSAAPASDTPGTAAKSGSGPDGMITMATRLSAAKGPDSTWMRAIILTPSASSSMSVTKIGDLDLTVMRSYFVKPQIALAMSFAADPTPGLSYDQFTGPAIIKLETKSFTMRAAALR